MDIQELKARARSLVVKGRIDRAEVLYRQVVTLVPRDAPAWVRHAETLRRLGRVDESVWSYRTAATILVSLGYEARAIAALKLALELKPEDVDLMAEIIRIEMHRKRRGGATASMAEAAKVVPLEDLERAQLALPMLTQVDLTPQVSSASGMFTQQPIANEPVATIAPAVVVTQPVSEPPRPVVATWPQVRRLNDHEVAIKGAPNARWVVISSSTPLDVRFADSLSIDADTPWLE